MTAQMVVIACIEKTKLQQKRTGKERLSSPANQRPIPAATKLKIIARTLIIILKRLLIEHTSAFSTKSYTEVTTPKSRMSTNSITGAYERQSDLSLFCYPLIFTRQGTEAERNA